MTGQPRVLWIAFKQFLVQIYKDAMLVLICIAPFLCGGLFKYILPIAEKLAERYIPLSEILQPYYILFDLVLGSVTPMLYCFAAAYVILSEVDDGLSRYLAVTPIGKRGYLLSRIGIPAVISFIVSIFILMVFHISNISILEIIGVSFVTSMSGVITGLLVVALSANKVEGMAVSKLTGLISLGLPAPFFINGSIQYLLFFLPSFWVAKFAIEKNIIYILLGIVISLLWMFLLYKRFEKKIR